MKILEKIKSTLKLAKSKTRGKRYVALQKPVSEMTYKEAFKEFNKKEKNIFAQEGNFIGRNKELISKVIFNSKDNDLTIGYFTKILNNGNIPKGVKFEYIQNFSNLFDDNELSKILSMDEHEVGTQFKIQIVRETIERVSEENLIKYYDYANIKNEYIRRLLNNIQSVNGKITILNRLNNKHLREKFLKEEIQKLNFDDSVKMLKQVNLYGYKEIEDYYISKIKESNSENVLDLVNKFEYISTDMASELDKLIMIKNCNEVINYINSNDIELGGIIYFSRKFNTDDKIKIFNGLTKTENRISAVGIFSEEFDKDKFIDIVKSEENEEVKVELINNMNKLVKEKFFGEIDIKELSELCTVG